MGKIETGWIVVFGVGLFLVTRSIKIVLKKKGYYKCDSPRVEALTTLRDDTTVFAVTCFLLWTMTPFTGVLISFDYPQSTADLQPQESLLKLLQSYNHAIVRTIECFQWFLYLLIFWLMVCLRSFLKAMGATKTIVSG